MKKEDGSLQGKFRRIQKVLDAALIERRQEIDGAMTAILAGQNFLMVGSPGTAKSLLCDGLTAAFSDELSQFSYLFMKMSTPEDIFGPYDVSGLMEGRYERRTDGYLPTAHTAFLDEIWKAGPAILNSLLKILNEKKFRNGREWHDCPLQFALAASNEYPHPDAGGNELGAMFDRFTIRMNVRKIGSDEGLRRLLWGEEVSFAHRDKITLADLRQARAEVARLPIPPMAQECLHECLKKLRAEGVDPGDRRKKQAVKSLRAYAYLNGRAVSEADFEILAHVLWDDPKEQPEIVRRVIAAVANPVGFQITTAMQAVSDLLSEMASQPTNVDLMASTTVKLREISSRMATIPDDRARRLVSHCSYHIKDLTIRSVGVK